MSYYGDIAAGAALDFKFSTANLTGLPVTLAGTPSLACYKNNSTTESTAGLTLSVDFDSKTGLHNVHVDTSADGTFYAAGSNFQIVIAAGTVNAISAIGYVVGEFSIINRPVQELASGVLTATAIAADAITAAKVASDVGTEIGTAVWATTIRSLTVLDEDSTTLDLDATIRAAIGMASANLDTQLSTISGYLDTEVAAILAAVDPAIADIKAKTDQLAFTEANALDVNIHYVNDVLVIGDGTLLTPWGPTP